MDVMLILTAALVMSVLGLIFGALLGVTGRVFKVPANEKAEALTLTPMISPIFAAQAGPPTAQAPTSALPSATAAA